MIETALIVCFIVAVALLRICWVQIGEQREIVERHDELQAIARDLYHCVKRQRKIIRRLKRREHGEEWKDA